VNLRFLGARRAARGSDILGMTSGLRRRLLVMLIAPLILLALLNAWFDYRSADNVAAQQDQRLLALVPLLADSVIGEGSRMRTAGRCVATRGWRACHPPRTSLNSTAKRTWESPGASCASGSRP
jgi:hypothetical protein